MAPYFFNRLDPLYTDFGFSRGWPIDRYYIEAFLAKHREDIRGEVLEAGAEPDYTRDFGGDKVTGAHKLFPVEGYAGGTLVGDLATGAGLPEAAYDALVLTQVFQCIYDMQAAVRTSASLLKDGGVLLATFSGLSQVSLDDADNWGEYWRITGPAAERMFSDVYGQDNVEVTSWGNVLTACCLMHGVVIEDLPARSLQHNDPEYPVTVSVRAVKRNETAAAQR